MIQCPNCGAKLPPRANICTFCQEVFNPDVLITNATRGFAPERWVVTSYYAVSGYFVLIGTIDLVHGLVDLMNSSAATTAAGKSSNPAIAVVGMIFAGLTLLFGIGLACRIEFVRGIANFICGMKILFGLLCAPSTIAIALLLGPFGVILIFLRALDIALAAFMIYLIGETDRLTMT